MTDQRHDQELASIRTEDVVGPDEPRSGKPTWERSQVRPGSEPSGLVKLRFVRLDADVITELLKERVRRIMWQDKAGTDEFLEVHRISRMCYEMSDTPEGEFPVLSNLSREDLDILYALDDHRVIWLTNVLNKFRMHVREAGPVGPVEADMVMKDFITVFEG